MLASLFFSLLLGKVTKSLGVAVLGPVVEDETESDGD